jgi:hypothetical protein
LPDERLPLENSALIRFVGINLKEAPLGKDRHANTWKKAIETEAENQPQKSWLKSFLVTTIKMVLAATANSRNSP